MSKKNTPFALSLLILALAGCATTYQPLGFDGGYKDMALSEDIYKVSFGGNSFTSENTVQDYLLRRCAEVTLQKGYKYFVIINGNTEVSHHTITTPTTVQTNSVNTFGYSTSYSTINYGQNRTFNQYENIATIKLLKNNKKYISAFNANVILNNFQKNTSKIAAY